MISQTTAERLGVATGDLVEITSRHADAKPGLIQPGHADDASHAAARLRPLRAGRVATGVGFNAGAIRTGDASWFDGGATVAKTGGGYKFAITQDHWSMAPDGRKTAAGRRDHARRACNETRAEFTTRRSKSGAGWCLRSTSRRLQRPRTSGPW